LICQCSPLLYSYLFLAALSYNSSLIGQSTGIPDAIQLENLTNAGNKAWATFDEKEKDGSRPISKEQRILIKKSGEWKLVTMLFFPM